LADAMRHAFSLENPLGPLDEADHALLSRLAGAVVRRRMETPAVLFLESLRPLNYLGSQALLFLRPLATTLFKPDEYERLTQILERREGLGALIEAIEAASASARREGQ